MSATILYLNYDSGAERTRRKLAGIRRFAKTHGWSVHTPVQTQLGTSSMRALLAQSHPIGCIVECTGGGTIPPPARFGNVPVVYLDPPTPPKWRGANFVCCDNAAVGRLAFEELSAGLPPCCAAVPCVSRLPWSDVRIAAFRERCEEAGLPCHVFDGKRNEDSNGRLERLADWIAALPRFCAVFAVNDFAAGDVAAAARRVHRHIPKELTLVGVDGMPDGTVDASPPGASSIQLDFELAGYLAAKTLGTVVAAKRAKDESNLRFATNSFGPLCVLRRESTRGRGRREPRILKAVEIIRAEATGGLTAAQLAARFPGSRKHFERRFREAMGHSILDEILHVRLEQARTLLASTEMPLAAIADFCGFGTDRELRWLFRKRTGTSLREWRAQRRR